MQTTHDADGKPVAPLREADPWRHVLLWSTGFVAVVLVVFMVVQQAFIPPIAVFILLALIGLFVLRNRQKAGAIVLVVVSLLFLALNLPFLVPVLSVPESSVDFLSTSLALLGLIAMIVSSIAVIRQKSGPNAMRFAGAFAVLCLVVVAGTIVARLAYQGAEAQAGDIEMVLEDFEFSPQEIAAGENGAVAVYLDNKDTVLHTFTIEELDVDVAVPGGGAARVTFDAEPGTYEFICVPHEPDMSGTLQVEG